MKDNGTEEFVVDDDAPWTDEKTLRELYIKRDYNAKEVGEELGTSERTILRWLRRKGVPIESPGPGHSGQTQILKDRDELRRLYVDKLLSTHEIADQIDAHHSTVEYWLIKHDIPRRPTADSVTGENHPRWKGGRDRGRGPAWDRVRKDVFEKYGTECVRCGIDRSTHIGEYGRDLDVHHLVRYGSFDSPEEANDLSNLIPLCIPCHNKWERVPIQPLIED